jgi:sugar O-acyltransferase (sialic acid O-acetyltransferase NeuD family)
MPKLALLGGGGFAKEIAEVARLLGYTVEDYFADKITSPSLRHGGYLEELKIAKGNYDGVALAVGGVNRKSQEARRRLIAWLDENAIRCPTIISPRATVCEGAIVEDGVFMAHNVVVAVDAKIGRFSLLNTNALIGHDTILEQNVVVSPLAFIGGGVKVGRDSLIGASANILQGITIEENVVIGIGSTVLTSVAANKTVLPSLKRA